eukprot:TRINITY_DN104551_c0_g1_i1.p1 TRINITY_DN104551_c0_g1~~TRINITY_DN104551_c0_g1_i1.p1  ORF type:complete len:380 (+),score=12.55 TRINITY_DN104551_c0_g1_i1:50-1189(+)
MTATHPHSYLLSVVPIEVVGVIVDYLGNSRMSLTCKYLWHELGFRFVPKVCCWSDWQQMATRNPQTVNVSLNVRVLSLHFHPLGDTFESFSASFATLELPHLLSLTLSYFCPVFVNDTIPPSPEARELAQKGEDRMSSQLQRFGSLHSLNIRTNHQGWWNEGLTNKPDLTTLKFAAHWRQYGYNDFSFADSAVEDIATSLDTANLPSLTRLTVSLRDDGISGDAMGILIDAVATQVGLRVMDLQLGGNPVGDDFLVVRLPHLFRQCKSMQRAELGLDGCGLTDSGVLAFTNTFPNSGTNLHHLSLDFSRNSELFGDSVLASALSNVFGHLHSVALYFNATAVTDRFMVELHGRFAECPAQPRTFLQAFHLDSWDTPDCC